MTETNPEKELYMSIPDGKSEVVRYIGEDAVGWVTRGTLCRVIQRTNGKVRVTRAKGKAGGPPQYLPEGSVEFVGMFENTGLFSTGSEADRICRGEPKPDKLDDEPSISQDEAAEVEKVISEASVRPPIPKPAPITEGRRNIRDVIRAEVAVAVREHVAEIVREEVDRYFGGAR